MLLEFIFALCLLSMTMLGLGWPVAARLHLEPGEKVVAAVILSLLGLFLLGSLTYLAVWPRFTLWLAPLLALAGLLLNLRAFTTMLRDPTARALLLAQLLVTAWCLGWLSLVASYSGGGWTGDWFEHWERARFWLDHGPLDQRFLGTYALPARPPLANLVTATFLALTHDDFAHYQIISTFFSSLAFLPAAILAHRFGGLRAIAVLAVFFAVNPLFVQNATFAWTKLLAACCVLSALYFFLRTLDASPPRAASMLFATSLATGLLIHYSAGPAAVVLAGAWLACGWPRRRETAWWRLTAIAALIGALILSTWFGWSLAHYGITGTFLSNSSIRAPATQQGSQLLKILLNLRDTLVPHFLRSLDPALIAQHNPWGAARDRFFQLYQLNLFFACGSVAALILAHEAWRIARPGWTLALAALVVLSVAVHGERDHWGVTHICLQSFVLLALAFLAARWPALTRPWRVALIAGAAFDFLTGIALHFAAQSFALDRWFTHGANPTATYTGYNESALMNLAAKIQHHLTFLADQALLPPALALTSLAVILGLMIARARAAAP
jgi:uncharacterized membrane protein